MFTDIEGSTRLLHRLGDAYAQALSDHRRLLRDAFGRHGGIEVDTQGDAFFVAFADPLAAVAASVAATRALGEHPWAAGSPLRVRIGLHTGVPIRTDEGYVGLDVHRGARIGAAGHGGQVLLSDATAPLVRDHLPATVQLLDLGLHRLKDLPEPQRLWQVAADRLDRTFPALRTRVDHPTNLVAPPNPTIGRQRETEGALAELRDGSGQVVTITGPGGTGKTRLAQLVGARALEHFDGGVFLVPLAAVQRPDLLVAAVASTLEVRPGAGRSIAEALDDHLTGRDLLLVLDNMEHLVGAGLTVAHLVARHPGLRILVTSREPLHLPAERVRPLATLSTEDAVALFRDRAGAAGVEQSASQDPGDAAVTELCRRLDGLPLAVELAAASSRFVRPHQLLARLTRRLDVLTSRDQGTPDRQRTLRATLDWSHSLLDAAEQDLFAQLGVFAGEFTIDDAEAVCRSSAGSAGDVLAVLGALVDKSLVQAPASTDGFRLLETIRAYAVEKLGSRPDEADVRDRHAAHFVTLAHTARTRMQRADGGRWVRRLSDAQAELATAVDRLLVAGDTAGATALVDGAWRAWIKQAQIPFGIALAERVLGATTAAPDADIVDLLSALSELHRACGQLEEARASKLRVLATCRGTDSRMSGYTLSDLGSVTEDLGDLESARHYYDEGLAVQRRIGDDIDVAHATTGLARLALRVDDLSASRAGYESVLQVARRSGEDELEIESLVGLGEISRREGRYDDASDWLAHAARQVAQMNDLNYEIEVAAALAYLAHDRGQPGRAVVLLAAVEALCRPSGLVLYFPDERPRRLAQLRDELGAAAFDEAWESGSSRPHEVLRRE